MLQVQRLSQAIHRARCPAPEPTLLKGALEVDRFPVVFEFYECLNKKTPWEGVVAALERAIHHEVIYDTGYCSLDYAQYKESIKRFYLAGGTVQLVELASVADGQLAFTLLTVSPDGEKELMEKTAVVAMDGRIVHVQPADTFYIEQMLHNENTEQALDTPMQNLLNEHNCGIEQSSTAWVDIYSFFEEIFDEALVNETESGVLHYDQYRKIVEKFSEIGEIEIGRMIKISAHRIRFCLRTTLADGTEILKSLEASLKFGKIIHMRPGGGVFVEEITDPSVTNLFGTRQQNSLDPASLKEFFVLLDRNSDEDFGAFVESFQNLFHHQLTVTTAAGTLSYVDWMAAIAKFHTKGKRAVLKKVVIAGSRVQFSGKMFSDGYGEDFSITANTFNGQVVSITGGVPASMIGTQDEFTTAL